MGDIILRQEVQSDRLSGTDAADGFQLVGGQAGDYVGEVAIVRGPQRDQQRPICLLRSLQAYVSILVVWREVLWREVQRGLQGGADESLMVV
jgi:hypothetical protein